MTVTFFQGFPTPEPPPRGGATRYVPPPWAGAPPYELPAVVHIGQFLHRGPSMVMAVKSAEVFSVGCSFSLTWVFRRGEQTDEDWVEMHAVFFHPGMNPRHGTRARSGLMFGVQLPDVSKASTASMGPHAFLGTDQEPEPPTLILNSGGGGGSDDELTGTGNLWLWPLPPAGDLRLITQWVDFGLEEISIVLDGGQLRDAAAGVQKFWPGGDQG